MTKIPILTVSNTKPKQIRQNNSALLSPQFKKCFQHAFAGAVQRFDFDRNAMIKPQRRMQAQATTQTTLLTVNNSDDNFGYPSLINRTRTHRTWLFGNVKRDVGQSPIALFLRKFPNKLHFGMSGRIVICFDRIMGACNKFIISNRHCSNWNFTLSPGFQCLVKSASHKIRRGISGRIFVEKFKRAGRNCGHKSVSLPKKVSAACS